MTDCQCLLNLNVWKTQNSQVARWLSELNEFNFEIKYKKGENMAHADSLSRAPIDNVNTEAIMIIEMKDQEILMFQRSDIEALAKIKILEKKENDRSKSEKERIRDYALINGLLYKKIEKRNQIVNLLYVPKGMRKLIAIRSHDLHSHFGIDKTVNKILEHYYFPKLRRYIKMHIRNCLHCIISKSKSGKKRMNCTLYLRAKDLFKLCTAII